MLFLASEQILFILSQLKNVQIDVLWLKKYHLWGIYMEGCKGTFCRDRNVLYFDSGRDYIGMDSIS